MATGDNTTEYINSTDYQTLLYKIQELADVSDDLVDKLFAARKLRFAEVDIEAERSAGRIAPDELYVPQKLIHTNIGREQPAYFQYITQSERAVVCTDMDDTVDLAILEKDLTKKLRFDKWQLSQFANIDAFQQNGYSFMEVIYDPTAPGQVSHETVQYGDFSFLGDTRDIQATEMCGRSYYYTRTRLVELCGDIDNPKDSDFDREQVNLIIKADPTATQTTTWDAEISNDKKSLYRLRKIMFRVGGIVKVGWTCHELCNDWVRKPRNLFIGRRKLSQPTEVDAMAAQQNPQTLPPSEPATEKNYPYIPFPYLISEDDTISRSKGRAYLDQDSQEAISSLMSSTVTQARRSSGLMFSRDSDDPNDTILQDKNVYFKPGSIINQKVKEFHLTPPDPGMFQAIAMLASANANETSQTNFAVNNRKDSRKTAKEVEVATQQASTLSTVQVVLFSIALRDLYALMVDVIKSQVLAKTIVVGPDVFAQYQRNFIIKPSGDVDVIEKQKLLQDMTNAWPVIQNTPLAQPFFADLVALMFPLKAPSYLKVLQQAAQQQAQQQQQQAAQAQSQRAQQEQMIMGLLQKVGDELVQLSKHKEMFSDSGILHVFPVIQQYAHIYTQMKEQQEHQQKQQEQMAREQQRKQEQQHK